uniref:Uncharacterized protein n=1 Tax=Sphaerodactylus townsendi TaxID=933632 RepID=A0ACB8E861_9SAUR
MPALMRFDVHLHLTRSPHSNEASLLRWAGWSRLALNAGGYQSHGDDGPLPRRRDREQPFPKLLPGHLPQYVYLPGGGSRAHSKISE